MRAATHRTFTGGIAMSRFVDFKAVKAAVSMLQVLEHYGLAESFKRTENSLSGPCPLHNGENRTQFRVSLDKNCWNCFGACKGGGNVLDFVARKEGCSLREAALMLCDWFQLPTQEKPAGPAKNAGESPTPDTPPKAERPPRASKAKRPNPKEDGPNKPLGFALQNLDHAHPYLAERRLSAEAIAEFGLGFCQKGSMTGRIVVPICNADGQLVAYAGRWPGTPPDDDTPKYRLPPGFCKAFELFNAHRAFAEPDAAPLVIVEGFFDCIALWQRGLRRVVALMGSSLSSQQEELIARAVNAQSRIVLMLDEDEAGREAREIITPRLAAHCYVRSARFECEGQQPDSLADDEFEQLHLT
jgi:DNA primase